MADPAETGSTAESAPGAEAEKKKRGRPKDEHAPPKPRNPYSRFAGEERGKLKESRPELVSDLSGMGKAIAEAWAKVSDEQKAKWQKEYDEEMEIWKPKWAEYKTTTNYKEFVEVKTDYLDKKAQKKLVKTMNKEAPKRPRSGYMIFAGEIREQVMEKVKAEGLGLGDAGRLISDRWNALTEAQKADYGEQSQKQKIEFEKLDTEYKKTEAWGSFCDEKAKLESTQTQKKLTRTLLGDAPKRAPSAFALYRSEVMPGIVKENEGKKEGEGKLTMGDMAKKAADMWVNQCSDQQKAELNAKAEKMKKEYDAEFTQFKAGSKYTSFLEKRQQAKAKENQRVHLREMPKKPKSVFAMFAGDHKNEVEPGKGEGKGTSALKQKFENASMEEKKKYEAKNAEMLEKWKEDVTTFKASPKYQTYEATKKKIEQEFKNEAIKVTTLKFLGDAPSAPAKSGFSVFVGEKRKAAGSAPGQKKSKEAKREEVVQAEAEWKKMDAGMRDAYETKRKELLKSYEETVKTFMASEKWKEYIKEAKRIKIPIRSLLFHKKKVIAKLADGKTNPASVQLPSKPESYPSKPQNAMQIFMAEKKKTIESVSEITAMWSKLSPDDKAEWDQKAGEQLKKFETDLQAFETSEEGKRYKREMSVATMRKKKIIARNKFLDDLPQKPASALIDYMKKNLKTVRKDNPEAKGFDVKKILTDKWLGLPAEEKEPLESAAKEKMDKYHADMVAFKASANWKSYIRCTTVRKFQVKKKGKVKAKAKPAPSVPVPENMPKKPTNAFQQFCKDSTGKIPGGLGGIQKAFTTLDEAEKKRYLEEAADRAEQYRKDIEAFNQSKEGRKYRSMTVAFVKRKRLQDLKDKFCNGEPKKNQTAFFLYLSGTRAKFTQDHPDVKGVGPVTAKMSEMWRNLSEEEKQPWLDKEKEEKEEYDQKLQAYQATDDYKKYRRLSASVLNAGKMKVKAKAKKKGPVLPKMPEKPADLPQLPKNGFHLFQDETRSSGGPSKMSEVNKAWLELKAEGQKKYMDRANELKNKYDADMSAFQKTAEGKKYLREKALAERKTRLVRAKERFLGGDSAPKEPKRPQSAYFLFLGEKRKESDVSGKSFGEQGKELAAKWNAMSSEEKQKYEQQAKERKEKYDEEMKAYKDSASYKQFARSQDVITGKKAREVAQKKARQAALLAAAQRQKAPARTAASPSKPAAAAASKDDADEMGSDSKSSKSSKSSSSSSSSSSD